MRDVLQGFPPYGISPASLPAYLPQRINAGAFWADQANSISVLANKPFGSGPGNTYAIYPTMDFPQVSVGGAQYWYVETSPPVGWTSTQVKFRVHFIVEDNGALPEEYRFTLGVKRNQDGGSPAGTKVTGNSDSSIGSIAVQKKISTLSGVITIPSATENDGLELEFTRGTAPSDDATEDAFVIGLDLFFV